jgi:type II secretory pathway pseudopilin PulG
MRALTLIIVSLCTALGPSVAAAQDAAELRRQIEQLQKELQSVTERLQRLEAQPPPTTAPAPAPAATPPAPAAGTPAPAASAPSALDVAQPRQPYALYQQRGAGQLLFDVGITGDFVGNFTQRNVEKAQGGTFAGQENRFFPREIELSLFGQIDPYASAVVRIEAGEDARGQETSVSLAEANVTLLTLPYGTQAKFGQMRNRFGYSNEVHEHDLAWVDRPNVMRNFFGTEGLQEKGVEATFVPDLPFYVEALAGIFNGDNETAFGRGSFENPLYTGRVRTFLEFGDAHALQLGMSVAAGTNEDKLPTTILGWEGRYKYRPDGWLHPLVTVTGEGLYSMRTVSVGVDDNQDGVVDRVEKRSRNHSGWYTAVEVQPFRRWAAGFRFDWSQFPSDPGWERAVEPYISFWPSEFLRFRLAYKNTVRSTQTRDAFNLNGGSARSVDEVLFQGTFIMGAHPAHPF